MAVSSRLFTAGRTPRHIGLIVFVALASLFVVAPMAAQSVPVDEGERQEAELRKLYRERRDALRRGDSVGREDIFGRDAWFHFQRSFPFGHIPADGRVNALRETAELERAIERSRRNEGRRSSLFAATMWESIGPTNQGGRIRAIAIHPTQSGVMLVGAAAGGVWRTTDGGQTWTPTFDNESAIAVGSLAYDHSNPTIVYAGTGENFPSSPTLLTNTPSYLGNGVFKSTDAGLTWTRIGLETAGAVSKLFVHRQNPSIVYAAVARQNGGFYRSTDAGATWSQTTSGEFFDMSVNPSNSDEIYIGRNSGVMRSLDAGRTFQPIVSGMTTTAGIRYSVSVSPSQPTRVYALAARAAGDGTNIAEAYRSDDRGTTWTLVETFEQMFFNGQGVYDNFITAHPTDPNVVLAGGIDVFRSTNGGTNWTNTTRAYSGGDVHADQHIAEFDPTNADVAVLGNDGGVYVSVDRGRDWQHQSRGLAVTQYYRMEVDQTRPYRVYGGTQDNGTSGSFGTTGHTGDWTNVLGGDGFFVVTDQSDPNWFYGELYYGALFRISANNPDQKSRVDWGIPISGTGADEGNWATPIAMSSVDRKSLYSGRTNLWRTTNRGEAWTRIGVGITGKLGAIGLSTLDADDLAVASLSGVLRYSTDYGATWATGRGLPSAVVTSIRYDPVRDGRLYLTHSGFGSAHVFRSDNDGADWVDISANLPRIPVNAIEIDPNNPEHLFIGTDVGAYFSPNGGEFWIPFNQGLPLAPISDLRIHRTSRTLVAATHGRSMFRVGIDAIEIEPTLVQPIGGERFTTPGTIEVRWFGFTGPANVSIRLSADEPFQLVATNVADGRATLTVPMRISSTARVRVEEIATGRTVTSAFFSLVTQANATSLGRRGFTAEALELRGSTLWATSRESDTIFRFRLPLLTGASSVVRSGFEGRIVDLAHDPARDEFLALVADAAFTSPRLYRMDTTGARTGEIPLPAGMTTAVGVAVQGDAIAITTASPSPMLWLLDAATGAERSRVAIAEAGETAERRGLVWNGRSFVQGAMGNAGQPGFDAELHQISGTEPTRLFERVPVVISSGTEIRFVGLAHDPGVAGVEYYYATDTSGTFYRFRADILGSVAGDVARGASSLVSRAAIRPNPAQHDAAIELRLERAAELRLAIVDAAGVEVADLGAHRLEPGEHALRLPIGTLASGMYFVVAESGSERIVRALTIVR